MVKTPVTYDSMRLLYRATLSMVSDASKQLWILSRLKSAILIWLKFELNVAPKMNLKK